MFLDHGGMNFLWQMELGEGGKSAGEGGFGGDRGDGVPTAESAQGGGVFQIIQEGAGGGEIPDYFGDESLGQWQAIFGFAADERPLEWRHEAFGMAECHDAHETLFLIGKRSDFLFEHGEELALDDKSGGGKAHKKS